MTEQTLRHYLLDLLPETQLTQVEKSLCAKAEDALDELISRAEHDLVWGYLHSRLSAEERSRFEAKFWAIPQRLSLFEQERALKEELTRLYPIADSLRESRSFGQSIASWLKTLRTSLSSLLRAPAAVPAMGFSPGGSRIHAVVTRVRKGESGVEAEIGSGSSSGIRTGDRFDVFPRIPNAGGPCFEAKPIGFVMVTGVKNDRCTGTYSGTRPVAPGDVARPRRSANPDPS